MHRPGMAESPPQTAPLICHQLEMTSCAHVLVLCTMRR